jgi:hypothetical protein
MPRRVPVPVLGGEPWMRSFAPPRSGAAARRPAGRAHRPAPARREAPAAARSPAPVRGSDGLPDGLQAVMEAMSGLSLADVVVHRNSAEPARLGALAYTRGSDIHLAPGEESHLPHEAWHAVQQKQGRVRPTIQMEQGVPVNDDAGLEREADLMGDKAVRSAPPGATAPVEPAPQASPAAAAQLCTIPVVQLGKDKKKRIAKSEAKAKKKSVKKKDRGVPRGPEGKMKAETQWPAQGNDHSVYVMADEESATLAAYEEEYDAPELFWRGDTRPPAQVFATGFTTNNERAGVVDKGANRIIWRSGGDTDDILPASAVCMAKDIRGGSFFPLTGASTFYLYAVGKTRIVNTFKAQQDSEADATGSSEFRRDERYGYDPEYTDGDEASAVWQFQEYAAHRVETTEIAAAFEVSRKTLVPPGAGADVAIAGVQFRLKFHSNGPIGTIKSKGLRKQMGAVAKEAREVAAKYEDWYPDEESFLSYMGIVKPRSQGRMPATMAEAPEMVRQTQAVVVQAKAKAGRSKSPAVSDARTSARPAAAHAPAAGALPEGLRRVMEAMSGLSLADVVVHRNSAEPARLGALAYTRGSDIHLGPGEESHLPHEAWHAVQQKQGRVQPTMQMVRGISINEDAGLESEADLMGQRAMGLPIGLPRKTAVVRRTAVSNGRPVALQAKWRSDPIPAAQDEDAERSFDRCRPAAKRGRGSGATSKREERIR